ncbi:VCBS repeat-containing protein [Aliifodinibius sp. S!AR15-10]|uniref:VCBS repeat-containing protein n=1 Tax=Aliifodinibius sp. S!AR15-10 TaxID=2950437 RepID=UPI00285AB187|nr:VCBS repeat-containing protein [Aliifodinibius sp. S!AR15-10]MDR8394187.1 VCBS repeat-containing protein [Aliifodinibius sp. S!AR15-10]
MIKPTKLFDYLIVPVLVIALVTGCKNGKEQDKLFTLLESSHTNIHFSNDLTETTQMNIADYLYFYDGGGVAVGDINNDGLKDLFFASNQSEDKLYLNRGDFVFEDISEKAGLDQDTAWSTGVAMADVNGDGYLDIYVSQLGEYKSIRGRNRLYINNGGDGLSFTEKAEEYGLDHVGFGTQASFFDYDNDGDLDAYLLNHSDHNVQNLDSASVRLTHDPMAGDKLLRNDTPLFPPSRGDVRGVFTDVTREAGIYSSSLGFGLGVAVSDLNKDGCIDIYIANDFHENDYLYVNNCDGTFTERLEQKITHTSLSSMGNDIADFNNDGLPDIVVLDMLPEKEEILKRSVTEEPQAYHKRLEFGYGRQLARNTLQLNLGNGHFSEIALLADVHATDWSWSPLFSDLDNDGRKDLFVTNGIVKRPNDLDFLKYKWQLIRENTSGRSQQEIDDFISKRDSLNLLFLDKLPTDRISNKVYRGIEDSLAFEDKTVDWGVEYPFFSNGAAYADLDNDGDLDLVLNNINEKAAVYRNNADTLLSNHYLRIRLIGDQKNLSGIGAKVTIKTQEGLQFLEQAPVRGFQSSVDQDLHFGLGKIESVDTVRVIWPDGRYQVLTDVEANQLLTVYQKDATGHYDYKTSDSGSTLLTDISEEINLSFEHEENSYNDFEWQPLLPHKLSTQGPKLAVGDVNGDGLDDFYAGGAVNQSGHLFIQSASGEFSNKRQADFLNDSDSEDVDAAFLDIDGDDDLDLYVVSGGNEWQFSREVLKDRLYINDGDGNFTKSMDLLPDDFYSNGSTVAPGDFDADGDMDLFVGTRSVINSYGLNPKNYLLQNNGKGVLENATDEIIPDLPGGMVTDAIWTDINNDQELDLVTVGEWMPVMVFINSGGKLLSITDEAGLGKTHGWWNTIEPADIDNDGDVDLIAGNLGLNSKIKASDQEPATMYVKDFNEDGILEQILCFYKDHVSRPFITRDELINQIPGLAAKFPTYQSYSQVRRAEDIFGEDLLEQARKQTAYKFSSSVFENLGNHSFKIHSLPVEANFAPIYSILADDVDGDGNIDLLAGGNLTDASIRLGLYDASYGLLLKGDGQGGFNPVSSNKSGVFVKGQIRNIKKLKQADGRNSYLMARNNDEIVFYR